MSRDISLQLLESWVSAGIISAEQAQAIWQFETEQTRGAVPAAAAPSPLDQAPAPPQALPQETRRVPPLAEVLGYAGGSLALGALVALTATYWGELRTPGRLIIFGFVAAICLASGWWLSANVTPQARRLGSFLLFVGVAALGCFVGFAVGHGSNGGETALFAGAGASFICGLAIWWKRRASLQLIAMTLALATLIPAAVAVWTYESSAAANIWGFGYVLLGVLWCLLAQKGRLKPQETAWALGSLALLSGPQVLALYAHDWSDDAGVNLLLGAVLSLALLGVAVRFGHRTPLALGAAGVVVFTPQVLHRWFGDAMGVPITLLIAGLLLLGMSAVVIRLRARVHKRGAKTT